MGARRRRLMGEAMLWLAIARLWLLVVPFRRVAARLGQVTAADAPLPEQSPPPPVAAEIGWAVRRSARYAPFRAVCLQQAVAAKMMLRRRGIGSTLHLGVARRNNGAVEAHAWLDSGEAPITGYPVAPDFVEVARWRETAP
jgi:hypothetical protein